MSPGPLAAASAVSVALIALYLALGGATYKPLPVADPCEPRPPEQLRERDDVLEQITLSALDGAACRLGVTREELTLALATPEARRAFAEAHDIGDEQIEEAVRAGLERAVDDARRVDAISSLEALLLEQAIQRLPVGVLIDALQTGAGQGLLERLPDLLGGG